MDLLKLNYLQSIHLLQLKRLMQIPFNSHLHKNLSWFRRISMQRVLLQLWTHLRFRVESVILLVIYQLVKHSWRLDELCKANKLSKADCDRIDQSSTKGPLLLTMRFACGPNGIQGGYFNDTQCSNLSQNFGPFKFASCNQGVSLFWRFADDKVFYNCSDAELPTIYNGAPNSPFNYQSKNGASPVATDIFTSSIMIVFAALMFWLINVWIELPGGSAWF